MAPMSYMAFTWSVLGSRIGVHTRVHGLDCGNKVTASPNHPSALLGCSVDLVGPLSILVGVSKI